MPRVVTPEILDNLPPADPRARRSRKDLRIVDAFMGNSRWMANRIRQVPEGTPIVEIGSGEGRLLTRLHRLRPDLPMTGLDLIERPRDLDDRIDWIKGDFFKTLPGFQGGACIGSLVLHHFTETQLAELGNCLAHFDRLYFCEPLRSRWALAMSTLASPFAGEVTRHDMPVSIQAGFQPREIPTLLKLDPSNWIFSESANWKRALRFEARRVA